MAAVLSKPSQAKTPLKPATAQIGHQIKLRPLGPFSKCAPYKTKTQIEDKTQIVDKTFPNANLLICLPNWDVFQEEALSNPWHWQNWPDI